ncbi:phosphatase PAP2 family protein [Actinocorallia sp. B10E7]|uniref:phosphatase PAP2 family protein n=1 Tax=Actinocorallia sp. B10E7 TaxID=3153558 RepID=UPI00325DF2FF
MALDSGNYLSRHLPAGLILLGVGASSALWLAPAGSGGDEPVRVQSGTSVSVYRSLTGAVEGTPSWAHTVLELASEATVAIMALTLVVVWALAVRRGDARTVAGTMMLGVGTVGAYALSEGLKLLVYEERPCRALADAAAVAPCPALGDWSFPSNHTTLAVGTAVGLAMLRPRLAALVLPLGLAAAVLRVAVGVHYPHDVLAGTVLGAAFSAAAVLMFAPLFVRVVTPLLARLGLGSRPVPEGGHRLSS